MWPAATAAEKGGSALTVRQAEAVARILCQGIGGRESIGVRS